MLNAAKEHHENLTNYMTRTLITDYGFNLGCHYEEEKTCDITYKTFLEENDPRLQENYLGETNNEV